MMPFHCPIEPNEHLLGWLCRVHLLSGNIKFAHTAARLEVSNTPLKGCNHNRAFQDGLNLFSDLNKSFEDHTAFGLWAISLQRKEFGDWKQNNAQLVKCGLDPNKFAFHSSWKYCSSCISEDINIYGHSIWHVKHQLPSITHCYKHQLPLLSDRTKLRDLRSSSLPQMYDFLPHKFENKTLMIEWSEFILTMFDRLNSNPNLGRILRERTLSYLDISGDLRLKDKPKVLTIQKKMDSEVPIELLEYLFLFYSQEFKRHHSILWNTLGYSVYEKAKHPVYWLIILYWLKDKISLEL